MPGAFMPEDYARGQSLSYKCMDENPQPAKNITTYTQQFSSADNHQETPLKPE
jgi:hypothetical protein